MPFVPAFTIAQTIDPSAIVLQDTSTGSDGAIASRQILLYTTFNTLLVPAIAWPLATNPITINPLQQDYGLSVTINWLNSAGGVIYTNSQIFAFCQYGEQFYSNLTRQQTSQPNIVNDKVYYPDKFILRDLLDSAYLAIGQMADIQSAQNCILLYQQMIQNQTLYF
jgi:hypothetical protein